ncbi:histidine kinase [Spirillospora sp. NPDC047279]|uniref:sensor histidine kinase n=1 Tax=Spirillospora sp. NPDC047279 TaxID=3155478 RepID=UPI0034061904
MRFRNWWSALWPTRRSRILDISLAAGTAVFDAIWLWHAPQEFYLPPPVVSVCSAVLALGLVVRRRHPVALALFMVVFSTVTGAGGIAGLIIVYSLGAYAASRRAVIAIAAAVYLSFLIFPGPTAVGEPFLALATFGLAFTALPVVLGLYMGARKQLIASLQERTRRLEREVHLLAEKARAEERTRIAREMHDVVANRVSVMVVHAGALKAVVTRDPDRAAETAAVIGDMGRQALDELRQVIGVLRQGERALQAGTPTMDDFRALVDQSQSAGLRAEMLVQGEERDIPPAVGRTIYRLVQEGLTNVHKHAGDANTMIGILMLPDAVEVEIENAPPGGRPEHGLPSGGNGLVGLRERVTALGGTFNAGPIADGGYALRARIPLPAGK